MKRCKHCGDPIEWLEFFDDGRGQWIHTDGTWLTCPIMPPRNAEPEESSDER